ncbi:hypothetical protein LTR16_002697, partial [Cryomyces antarcticus]
RIWQSNHYAAIKITDCRHASKEAARHELNIYTRIAGANPDHRGRGILRTVINSFKVVSPNGSHLCLVFEPMREPLWLFRRRFGADKGRSRKLPSNWVVGGRGILATAEVRGAGNVLRG